MKSEVFHDRINMAPARSLFKADGFTDEDLKKPLIGIVTSFNEIVPGHMHLDKLAEAVKLGVAAAGGTPVLFPAMPSATASPWAMSGCATPWSPAT